MRKLFILKFTLNEIKLKAIKIYFFFEHFAKFSYEFLFLNNPKLTYLIKLGIPQVF